MHTEAKAVLAKDLRVVVGKLCRRLREQSHTGDFTAAQRSVVIRLESGGPATISALARAEAVRPQSMGATVASLQEAGLVASAPDPTDGRQSLLSLTDACRERIRTGRAAKEDWLLHALTEQLSAVEQTQLAGAVELLRRLADS